MSKTKIHTYSRIGLAIAGLALLLVLYLPIWRIDLSAPQYPEGLNMYIHANGLKGDVEIINGLNHYIGMRTLHTADFPEFIFLPYIIGLFVLSFLLVAATGSRFGLNVLVVLFIIFGVVSMVDFWMWEYNYGHNLDPSAPIIVPGMAYQPPLIGFKQLLNFGAYSIPDSGGWIFISAGVILFITAIREWRFKLKSKKALSAVAGFFFLFSLSGCAQQKPEPFKLGKDACHFCKMTIADARFGAEIISSTGRIYKFDDIHCLLEQLKQSNIKSPTVYLADFGGKHELIHAEKAFILKGSDVRSPMGGSYISFSSDADLIQTQKQHGGDKIKWSEVK